MKMARTALRLCPQGYCLRGQPIMRWLDQLKEDMNIVNAAPEDALECAKRESFAKNRTLQTSGINDRTKKIYMNHLVGVDSYINVVFYK